MACALMGAHALIYLACGGESGDRARTGECPAGEVCGAETPEGLRFSGARLGDRIGFGAGALGGTAVGGTQGIEVERIGEDAYLPPFTAHSDGPAVLAVDSVDGRRVGVRGLTSGSANLRILNGDGELLDRISLPVGEVETLGLRSPFGISGWTGPMAFRRGARGTVVVALYDEDGARLVDDSVVLAVPEGATQSSWDSVEMDFEAEGDELTVALELGAGARTASAPLVDAVESIRRVSSAIHESSLEDLLIHPTLRVGHERRLCFRPMAGEHGVVGAELGFSAEGPIEVRGDDDLLGFNPGCAIVEALSAGDAVVIVRADEAELRQPVRVVQ